jgi:hypothetical protein
MQRSYAGKIDLLRLTKEIVQFFEARKCGEITALQTENGYQIIAGDSSAIKIKSDLKVDIHETTEGFSVSLELSKETKRFNYPMMLAMMFGGGYFFLKDLKSDESWKKIEREFWLQTNNMIARGRDALNTTQEQERKGKESSTNMF